MFSCGFMVDEKSCKMLSLLAFFSLPTYLNLINLVDMNLV
jgi:hypothetical protein